MASSDLYVMLGTSYQNIALTVLVLFVDFLFDSLNWRRVAFDRE